MLAETVYCPKLKRWVFPQKICLYPNVREGVCV